MTSSRVASAGWLGGACRGGVGAFLSLLWLLLLGLRDRLGVLLVLVDGPVEDIVVLEAFANKEITEDLAEVGVVGLVVESEGSGVVEVDGELVGKPTAQDLGWSGHLLLHDTVVLLLLGSSLETLPWKGATAEVEHNISERLHVITSRLLDTQVGVDGSITGCAGQVLVLTVWNVEVCLWVTVLLCQSEINHVDLVATLADAHQEVIWLDIAVDEGFGVDVFDAGDELIGEEEDGLEGEFAVAEIEQIF